MENELGAPLDDQGRLQKTTTAPRPASARSSFDQAAPSKRRRSSTYHIILFYNYRGKEAPALPGGADAFCAAHRALCAGLGLTGRVLIAEEGLNGTLATRDPVQLDIYTGLAQKQPTVHAAGGRLQAKHCRQGALS